MYLDLAVVISGKLNLELEDDDERAFCGDTEELGDKDEQVIIYCDGVQDLITEWLGELEEEEIYCYCAGEVDQVGDLFWNNYCD
ncbi:MAG: hypothetical protein EZS28_024788 [Streblomastix strix]|uniref:Uncharacterized protein n=1 Tax=Streblomastix strix TaxID=222440 RepID=A0A5J4VB15_9EUKA|nr:MAG: hypothetical protein EZS28_024788 [Streblomastix strix]